MRSRQNVPTSLRRLPLGHYPRGQGPCPARAEDDRPLWVVLVLIAFVGEFRFEANAELLVDERVAQREAAGVLAFTVVADLLLVKQFATPMPARRQLVSILLSAQAAARGCLN